MESGAIDIESLLALLCIVAACRVRSAVAGDRCAEAALAQKAYQGPLVESA
jgi:hypothetical protein